MNQKTYVANGKFFIGTLMTNIQVAIVAKMCAIPVALSWKMEDVCAKSVTSS